jgi:hypothetical protein
MLQVRCGSWLCENSSDRRARRNISKKLRTMESNHAAPTMFDTLSENCIFYISPMYEFSHRLGHNRKSSARTQDFRSSGRKRTSAQTCREVGLVARSRPVFATGADQSCRRRRASVIPSSTLRAIRAIGRDLRMTTREGQKPSSLPSGRPSGHRSNQLTSTMCEPCTRIIPSAAASPSVLRKMYVL